MNLLKSSAILLLFPLACQAGHCRVKVAAVHHAVVLQQAVPAHYYSVGAAIQENAVAERVATLVMQRLSALQTQPAGNVQALEKPSLVAQRCGVCHSGENAKAGLRLDLLSEMDCETKLKAMSAVLHDQMPPKGAPRLNPDEAGELLKELAK